ncbi:cytochrome P450 1B1 isoform X2 [Epinephelus fuscoguttatus]|uniref:cytochrome P450 1B1 isoform X2 n=1 Tax=Epinephelus fuscoguttatus TaxID=293821 RepID=UPI0020D1CCE3|nr:cytochrome P450 1B1 isoform X2 [Epinephelus fuscoguttatus]
MGRLPIMDFTLEGINPATPGAVLLACVTLLLSLHLWRWLQQRSLPCLPGPLAWPVVGNAPQLGNAPHLYFTRMAKKYGNVFQVKLGSRAVVVLNGDSIKQALVKQGSEFAGRPDFTSFQYISEGASLAFGTMTDLWKMHRRVAQSTVRMFSTGNPHTKKTFEHHIICEFRELLKLFVEKTKEQQYFQPMTYLVVSTANIMSAVCFGNRYSHEDEEFRQVVGRNDQFTQTVGAGSIVDVMPWLQYFPNPVKTIFENFKRLNVEFSTFIQDKVIQHRKTIQSNTIRDMTDAFIVAMDKLRVKSPLSAEKDYVPPAMGDIFGASQDTLSTALQWIILILVKYPEMQMRLQEEVDRVVDRGRLPSIEDQLQLPYIMAFIYEVMRYTSFVPLTIPHSTTTDTSLNGYPIPKDTVVFVNQWSINHDPALWSHPEVFDPQRFLDQNGALNKDLTSTVLIFSMGKRRCIGEELSKLQLFLFMALIAHQCNITVDPSRPVKLDFNYGLTLKPHAFSIAVTLREDMKLLDAAARQAVPEEVKEEPSLDT